MKILTELKPTFRSLLSRMTKPLKVAEITATNVLSFVRTRTFATAIFFLITMLIIMTAVLNTKIVQVNDSNGLRNVFTLRTNPITILAQCGVRLNSDDTIDFSGFKKNYGQIKIYRAFSVGITADQKTQNIYISRGTVSDVLNKAGVKVGSDDIVSEPLTKTVFQGLNIQIHRAFFVGITADQKTQNIYISRGTVSDVLNKAGVKVGSDDIVSEPLTKTVSQGLNIQIKRVAYKEVQEKQVINCKLIEQKTPLLNMGKTKVLDPGKNGEYTITMKLRYVDGTVEKQDIIKKEVTKKPTNGKVLVGTNSKTPVSRLDLGGQILTNRGEPERYTKCLTGMATAYYAKPGAGTASGRKAAVGNIAVDPKLIPYGSRLYVVSSDGSFVYGYAIAADTGGFCYNGSGVLTDLYFNSKTECNMFGKRSVKIYVLE